MSAPPRADWRDTLYAVIFEADTRPGRLFDVLLLGTIALSVIAVALESVPSISARYGNELRMLEWGFTIVFTLEYILRIICVARPLAYMTSFYGVVDLLAIVPTYASLFVAGTQSLAVIRAVRFLRMFRVLKLTAYVGEATLLSRALWASSRKIGVFFGTLILLVLIVGSTMYLIEGPASGFTSIPQGMYWAVVTMTTVGYGDIAPISALGKLIASFVMLLGYAILAVPTGIVTVELAGLTQGKVMTRTCESCMLEGHDRDAAYCRACGEEI